MCLTRGAWNDTAAVCAEGSHCGEPFFLLPALALALRKRVLVAHLKSAVPCWFRHTSVPYERATSFSPLLKMAGFLRS